MREVSIHEDLSQKYDFTLMPQTILLQESMKRWIVELDDCRKIFDDAIIHQNYSVLDSLCYTLPYRVSFAVSSCFPVVFDVYGSPIPHKDDLMQMVYICNSGQGRIQDYFFMVKKRFQYLCNI